MRLPLRGESVRVRQLDKDERRSRVGLLSCWSLGLAAEEAHGDVQGFRAELLVEADLGEAKEVVADETAELSTIA